MDAAIPTFGDFRTSRLAAHHGSQYSADVANVVTDSSRLLLVSNRLPLSAITTDDAVELRRSSGGLVSALEKVHDRPNSFWIGYVGPDAPGARHEVIERLRRGRMAPVSLSDMEVTGFYRRYSNGILWPALHGLTPPSPRDRCGWGMYRAANERFASVVAAHWRPGDRIWVHDYQLMLLPQLLRRRLPQACIGFFLHTPVPAPDELTRLPEWEDLARGLLGADVIGFQTHRDAEHFLAAAGGTGTPSTESIGMVAAGARRVRVIASPIGIDSDWFEARTRHPAVVAARAALRLDSPGTLFLGVDRLDYTKGIPERLLAFERLLLAAPELRERAQFMQIAVPSRDGVAGYAETRQRVESIVARINMRFGTARWQPVTYRYGSVDPDTLVALYAAADVMVVTPKRDGMNLVAKEFVAARSDGGGALVLSRHAGAAAELRAAILVDPDDVTSIVEGYRRALAMSPTDARPRMRELRATVASGNVYSWADRFLSTLPACLNGEGEMDPISTSTVRIDHDDLAVVAALASMRFHQRAPEVQRAARLRDIMAAAAELSKALARYVQNAGIVAETPRLERDLAPDAMRAYEALDQFASLVRVVAAEFRTVVRGPLDLPVDVPVVRTSTA